MKKCQNYSEINRPADKFFVRVRKSPLVFLKLIKKCHEAHYVCWK